MKAPCHLFIFMMSLSLISCNKNDDSPTDQISKPGNFQIIFIENSEGAMVNRFQGEVKCIDANGENLLEITSNNSTPAVQFMSATPNRRSIALQAVMNHACFPRDVLAFNPPNPNLERWTNSLNQAVTEGCAELITYSDPWWSPDGSAIACVKSDRGDNSNSVVILNASGQEEVNLSAILNLEIKSNYKPRWSPDGQKLAFSTRHFINDEKTMALWRVCVINRDGSNPTFIGTFSAAITTPVWSPDGSRIIYSVFEQDPQDFSTSLNTSRIMNSDGSNDRFLTTELEYVFVNDYAWFSDGVKVLVEVDLEGNGHSEIAIMNSETGSYEQLTNTDLSTTNSSASLSPDEEWILYTGGSFSAPGNTRNLWKMRIDGTDQQQLTSTNYVVRGLWIDTQGN